MADRPDADQTRLFVPIEEWSVEQPWDLTYHLRRIGALLAKETAPPLSRDEAEPKDDPAGS